MSLVTESQPDDRLRASSSGWLTKMLWLSAIALFVASLTQTAVVVGKFHFSGIIVLGLGWTSLFSGHLAWLANGFFSLALMLIASRNPENWKIAAGASIAAVVFALDTVRFTETIIDEAGNMATVRGYGWGAVLWFAALCLALATVGSRYVDARLATKGNAREWLRPFGLVLFLCVVAVSAYWSEHDRQLTKDTQTVFVRTPRSR